MFILGFISAACLALAFHDEIGIWLKKRHQKNKAEWNKITDSDNKTESFEQQD